MTTSSTDIPGAGRLDVAPLRFENVRISDDRRLTDLVEGLADELWSLQGPPHLAMLDKVQADATVTAVSGQRRAESSAAVTNFGPDFLG